MKALSVRQPHVAAILSGQKRVEYRTWHTRHRGLVLLHASSSKADLGMAGDYEGLDAGNMPLGCIVGAVEVTGCEPVEDPETGEAESYDWELGRVIRFDRPIPLKGKVGLFDVDDALVADQLQLVAQGQVQG